MVNDNILSILSLNTFGIPFFLSWGRLGRLARILDTYRTTILCLQEIQQNAYIPILTDRLKTYAYHAVYPHLYAPKGGLGTFSRLPLTKKYFEPYLDRGLRWLITFSDWALFKGILISHLKFHDMEIVILNTHMNANYTGDWRRGNPLGKTQYKQVQQLERSINRVPANALVVLCGDFNFPRSSYLYEELIANNGLIDPLQDDIRPTYRPFPLVPSRWKISLDYLLLRLPSERTYNIRADIVVVEDLTQKNPINRFLTDHCALTLNIRWSNS